MVASGPGSAQIVQLKQWDSDEREWV